MTGDPETEFIRDFEPRTPLGALARVRDRLIVDPLDAFADDTAEAIETQRAEALIFENLLLGCYVAGARAGIPTVSLVPNVFPGSVPGVPPFGMGLNARDDAIGRVRDRMARRMGNRLWDRRLDEVNQALGNYEQPPLSTLFDIFDRPDRLLVLTSASFEIGGGVNAPPNVRYCGPRLEDPDWVEDWEEPEGRDPLILVALSTTTQGQAPMLDRIVDALGRLPVRGLVTTGPSFDPELMTIPENVKVVTSAPHSAVMSQASVVITHAGHGTVMKALARGVPLLCLPVGRDQPDTAARVVACGAGLRLRPGAGAGAIAKAVDRLLTDPAFRESALRMSEAIAADRERDLAVQEIEELTKS